MAITSTYPIITPKVTDLIVGTQTYTAADPVLDNPTRNFTVQSVADLASSVQLGYTSYTARFVQQGTSDPVVTDMYNNTGATFTWTRTAVGEYTVASSLPIMLLAKTFINIQGSAYTSPPQNDAVIVQPDYLAGTSNFFYYRSIKSTDATLIDSTAGWLEIRIYN